MISFPNAKINLGLHIVERRSDGFHNLETCFVPVPKLSDSLEMLDSERDDLTFFSINWNEPKNNNLIWRAMDLFRREEPNLKSVHWRLLKKIPTGGGLGGGSSDAAFALKMLAQKAGWSFEDPRLFEMAAQLGSDCPFFLENRPMIGTGRGEVLDPFDLDMSGFRIEFAFPSIHISTSRAFSNIVPRTSDKALKDILSQPITTWKSELKNDFEIPIFKEFPELEKIKSRFYENGAFYSAMSGSGSTVFGLFQR